MAVRDTASLLFGVLLLFHTWGVWADVEVNMEDRVEVFRGQTAQITCMFTSSDGVGGMMIQWSYMTPVGERQRIYFQDSTMQIVEQGTPFTGRIGVNGTGATGELVLTIADVQLEDELEFICQINSLTDGKAEGRTQLKVFETPELPTIEGVDTGISITEALPPKIGNCEARNGFPKPNITWYRDNMPLHHIPNEVDVKFIIVSESSGLFSVKSELSMKVRKEDKDALFYCEVTYFVPGGTRMTETNRININVYYPATAIDLWVASPEGKIKEGDTVALQCHSDGNPPPLLTFRHQDYETSMDSDVVMLNNVTRLDSGVYYCVVYDLATFEETIGNTSVFVNYLDHAVVTPEEKTVFQGEEVNATCNALSSLQTDTVWFKDGVEVSKGHTLALKDTVFDTSGTYVCVVTVPELEGMETSGTLRVFVNSPPEIMGPMNTDIEETVDKTINLSCHAKGLPSPNISWTSSDGQPLKTVSNKITEDGVHSVVSVKVTSDISAFCNASNEYGTDSVAFSIKAIKHITTTTSATTTTTTTTTTTVKAETSIPPKKIKKEGSGVVVAVLIICLLLLAILGAVLYFLYKKGKICGRSGKQDLTTEKSNNDNIVVEMKSDNTEEAVLLGINGDKKPPSEQ